MPERVTILAIALLVIVPSCGDRSASRSSAPLSRESGASTTVTGNGTGTTAYVSTATSPAAGAGVTGGSLPARSGRPPPPPTAPRLQGEKADQIYAYLREHDETAIWFRSIKGISLNEGRAQLSTDIVGDGKGRAIARDACDATLANDRVPLSSVTVKGNGDGPVAECSR